MVVAVGVVAFGRAEEVDDAVAQHLMTVNAPAPAAIKAALASLLGLLGALRRERRRGTAVLEARLPHLDTGFAGRPVAGRAPALPQEPISVGRWQPSSRR